MEKKRKRVIVIGATSGMGRAVAQTYIERDDIVGITGRRSGLLEEIKSSNPEKEIYTCQMDVTSDACVESLESLICRMGGVDIVLYSSGYGKENKILNPEIEMQEVMVNIAGFVRCSTCLFNYWSNSDSEGQLAVISSIASCRQLGIAPGYSATKKYQAFYMETLRQLAFIRGSRVSLTTLKPGFVDTDFIKGKSYPFTLSKEKAVKKIVKAIDLKRKNCIIYGIWRPIALLMKIIPAPLWRRLGPMLAR